MIFSQTEKDNIRLWRSGGFSYTFIAHSLNKKYGDVKKFCQDNKIIRTVSKLKPNKYDHLFLEKMNQGKFYKDYVKLHK
jgi:hypothetical protein